MVKIYIEGGAPGNLATELRHGFTVFFKKAGIRTDKIRPVACYSRQHAYDRFYKAWTRNETCYLLVDSEFPISSVNEIWSLLGEKQNGSWVKPPNSQDEHCHLMVECMENWLLTDHKILQQYYGRSFHINALPRSMDVEKISKRNALAALTSATKNTSKGRYSKGKHSFEILAMISPESVSRRCQFCKRLIDQLKKQ